MNTIDDGIQQLPFALVFEVTNRPLNLLWQATRANRAAYGVGAAHKKTANVGALHLAALRERESRKVREDDLLSDARVSQLFLLERGCKSRSLLLVRVLSDPASACRNPLLVTVRDERPLLDHAPERLFRELRARPADTLCDFGAQLADAGHRGDGRCRRPGER